MRPEMEKKRKIPLKKYLLCAADAVWLGFIFFQSLRSAAVSSVSSGRLTRLLQWLLHTDAPVETLEHFVRKLAHFAEFFILGALVLGTLAAFGAVVCGDFWQRLFAPAALTGLLTALCDETLQLLSPGRSAQISDVWLDWAGYLCGLILCRILLKTVVKSAKKRYHYNEYDPE